MTEAPNGLLMPKVLRFDHRPFTTEEMHEAACAHGEDQFARYGECMPTWVLNVGNRLIWFETAWRSSDEKYDITSRIALLLQMLGGESYTLISEAYVAAMERDDDGKMISPMPADRPKHERDEILMLATIAKSGQHLFTRYLISARRTGPNFLGPRADEDYTGHQGDMTDLFERTFPPQWMDSMEALMKDFLNGR